MDFYLSLPIHFPDPEVFDLAANIPDLRSDHWQVQTRRELIERIAVDVNYAYDAYRAAQN